MEVLNAIREHFTTQEQDLFVSNFHLYLTYDQDTDHVIDFDKVVQFCGFARKENAKRLLVKHIKESKYTITNEANDVNILTMTKKHGGHNKEMIMLTPNAFKEFCMRADTEMSQRVREYYIKMESIFMKLIKDQLATFRQDLESSSAKIKHLEAELAKAAKKRFKEFDLGDTVYIIKQIGPDKTIYKVGSTDNMNTRQRAYFTTSTVSEVVYAKRCHNKKILEDVVHNRLRHYQFDERKDWFDVDFETIKNIVDKLQLEVDGIEAPNVSIEMPSLEEAAIFEAPIAPPLQVVHKPVNDFAKFFEECFVRTEDGRAIWIDVTARYRLWSRMCGDVRNEIRDYMLSAGFTECFVYDPITSANTKAWAGLEMIPVEPLALSDDPSIIEQFLYDTCTTAATARISLNELYETLFQWLINRIPDYEKLTKQHRNELKDYCSARFVGTTVHTGERIRFGYYGLCLKDKVYIGRKFKNKNRKTLEKVDTSTGEVVDTYQSLTHASNELGMYIPRLSNLIKHQTICDGFLYRFATIEEED